MFEENFVKNLLEFGKRHLDKEEQLKLVLGPPQVPINVEKKLMKMKEKLIKFLI